MSGGRGATGPSSGRESLKGYLLVLFAVSVGINYVWEMAQMPFYRNMPYDELRSWLLCFRASLGDGVIILTIWLVGFLLFRRRYWFDPRPKSLGVLLATGALIAILIELHALETGRWSYSAIMPLVPPADVGLSPLLQMLVLPYLSMVWSRRLLIRSLLRGT